MASLNMFKDADGREWTVEISTATLRRLRDMAKFLLDDIICKNVDANGKDKLQIEVKKYQDFLDDDLRFAEVMYAILKPDADAKSITQEMFENGLRGKANQDAIIAFHTAFADFSRPPRSLVLRGLKLTMEKQEKLTQIAERRMTSEAAKLDDTALEKLADDAVNEQLSKRAGNLAGV